MFGTMLFLHLTGLSLWFGALMAIVILVFLIKGKKKVADDTKSLVRKAIRTFSWVAHPSSIIVLVSGIFMIIEMNLGDAGRPLWLNYMEKAGGTIILIAIILTAVLGRKMVKQLAVTENSGSTAVAGGGLYQASLVVILAAILSVVLVVSLRLM